MLFSDFESRLTMRAPDGWDSARFLGFCLSLGTFPSLSLVLNQPPVTLAVRRTSRIDNAKCSVSSDSKCDIFCFFAS